MIQKIREYMHRRGLIGPGDHVIAGVSGGADSVCLLYILKEICEKETIPLTVLHVEHGIRGAESMEDAFFVEQLCKTLSVDCQVVHIEVPSYAREHRMGYEEAARTLRYEAYGAAAERVRQSGYAPEHIRVALAHHREDLVETVLFQLLRGSGISGLCGIRPERKDPAGFFYIRPMLAVSRQEIEDYLSGIGQEFRTDRTNLDTGYTRNRIRQEILPKLHRINDRMEVHIQQTAEQMERIEDYLLQQAAEAAKQVVRAETDRVALDIPALQKLHPAIREEVLRQALFQAAGCRKDISAVHIEMLRELTGLQSGSEAHLPYRIRAFREYDRLVLEKKGVSPPKGDITVAVGSRQLEALLTEGGNMSVELPEDGRLTLRVLEFHGEMEKIPKKTYTKWLDYDKIKNGFVVRKRMPGDYFCMDAQGHHKKLKQYFAEEKIPAALRGSMWLAAQESKVLWLMGGRISEDVKLTVDTHQVLELIYEGGKQHGF